MTEDMELPMQPVYKDKEGVSRFVENKVVRYLLDNGSLDMNDLAKALYSQGVEKDWEQFAQLIGYSVYGFGELSYVSEEAYELAIAQTELLEEPTNENT